jgi:hypothetical protein
MGRRVDIKPLPSLERLNELLSYDPETGALTWKSVPKGFQRAKAGDPAGTIGAKGYRVIGIDRKYYLAHRIIWKLMTGSDPDDQIDHKNTDRLNNRWENLRPVENGQNIQNSNVRKDNLSGVKGIHWDASHKKWRAVLRVNGKTIRLGRFSSKDDAANVIANARLSAHGEFARLA